MHSEARILEKLVGESVEVKIDLDRVSSIKCACGHTIDRHEEPKLEEGNPAPPTHGKCKAEGCVCSAYVKADIGEKAWMAPLGAIEKIHAQAVANEAWRTVKDSGGDDDTCAEACARCEQYAVLYYTLRTGPAKNAPRLFPNLRSVQLIPPLEVLRLCGLQADSFCPTEEELKNCLRERITG